MAITVEKTLLNNQSILQNIALVEQIDEQAAEIISGGAERFLVRNKTKYRIRYIVDGAVSEMRPGESDRWISDRGGKITFDIDGGPGLTKKSYNLSDRKIYEFQDNRYTSDPNDINLYKVGVWRI
jgi:hypothetical protein